MSVGNQRRELAVGIFLLGGLLLLGWLVFQFGRFGSQAGDHYSLFVEVRDATGIREGIPVRLAGLDIGFVGEDPEFTDDSISLVVPLQIQSGRKIPKGSTVKIGTSGLLGDSFIRVIPPPETSGEFYSAGEQLAAIGPASLDDLAGGAMETLVQTAEVLDEIGHSVRSLNELFVRFDEGVLSEENLDHLNVLMAGLRTSSERIEVASRRLDPLLEESTLAVGVVRKAAEGAHVAFDQVTLGVDELTASAEGIDPVLKEFDSTLDQLRGTLVSVNRLVQQLESGDGLASALIRDSELRRDLTSFVDKLNRSGVLFYPRDDGPLRRLGSGSEAEPGTSSPVSRKSSPVPRASARAPAAGTSSQAKKENTGIFRWLQKKQD